jgi:acyl-coenzyme A synthetase/AMP-(fatty) acid ligase
MSDHPLDPHARTGAARDSFALPTVAGLAPLVAPTLARSPQVSPILAHHRSSESGGESLVAFGRAGARTADDLLADVARVAAVLPDAADDEREILCVAGDRYHFTVALLAAWQRGHRVALPPNAQTELLRAMADDPRISLVIHDTDELTGLDLRPLLTEAATAAAPIDLCPLPAPRELVSVWTSGSTGEHQRHAKTAGQLFAEALTLAEHFGLGKGVRVVATVPSHHIYGLLFSVLVPLVSGGSFSRDTPLHAGVVRATLLDTAADVLVSVPAHLRALKILDPESLPNLARVFSSGAPLPPDTAMLLHARFGWSVTEVLGSTETGGIAWRVSGPEIASVHDDDEALLARIWTPLPHVRVDVDIHGQLLVDSPFLPPEGARPWPTADRIELVDDSAGVRFRHLGRSDGVVKIGGKRVSLAEIERRLLAIDGVEDAAVWVVEVDGVRGNETVALVVAPGCSPEHLRTELRQWLDPVVIPRRLRLVDALPREANGKLTRRRLLEALDAPKTRVDELHATLLASETPDTAAFAVYVPRDLYALRGHFRKLPIVPGVATLELARASARSQWPDLGARLARVLRLKFQRPVRPGEHLRLELSRRAGGRVDFKLLDAEQPAASGTMMFE